MYDYLVRFYGEGFVNLSSWLHKPNEIVKHLNTLIIQ